MRNGSDVYMCVTPPFLHTFPFYFFVYVRREKLHCYLLDDFISGHPKDIKHCPTAGCDCVAERVEGIIKVGGVECLCPMGFCFDW